MDFWGVAIGAGIASFSWLYQKAWDRHQARTARYQEIIDRLPAFTQGGLNSDVIDEILREIRRLWLIGPDDVIQAANNFLQHVEGVPKPDHEKDNALAVFVIAMRNDASFKAAIFPRFWRSGLKPDSIRIKTAARAAPTKTP